MEGDMADYPASVWRQVRDDRGHVGALRECYPDALASDLRLQMAIAQIETGQLAIDAIMQQRDEQDDR